MGLFSSEYKTQVATTVSRVIEDDALPDAVLSGTLKSHFENGDIPEYVIEELVTCIGSRAERMYAYADKNYTYGLPSGEVYSSTQGRAQVEATIEAIEGQQVLIEYSHFGPPNALHIGWSKLVAEHGYVQVTNQLGNLTAEKGTPVYLMDMVVVAPAENYNSIEPGVLALWGTAARAGYTPERINTGAMSSPTAVVRSVTATNISVLVTYVWQPLTPVNAPLSTGTFTIDLDGYDGTQDYFQAKYTVGTQAKYWSYLNKSGTYPLLDEVFVDGPATAGSYFPFTYFRFNKTSMLSDTSSEGYKTSKKMVKYLGIDYDLIAETIHSNPGIGDVEQAMMVMGVPPTSTDKTECRYLFDYFNQMYYAMGSPDASFEANSVMTAMGQAPTQRTTIIKDSRFKMSLSNNGIYKKLIGGSIGPVGTYAAKLQVTDVGATSTYASTNAVVTYTGTEDYAVVEDPLTGYLWSLDKTFNNENLLVFDPATETLIKKIPLAPYFATAGGAHIIYVPTTRSMWVLSASSTSTAIDLIRVDIATYSIATSNISNSAFLNVNWGIYDPFNDCVYLASTNGATSVAFIRASVGGTPFGNFTTGWPTNVTAWIRQGVIMPNGTMAVRMFDGTYVPIIDLASNTVIKTITTSNSGTAARDNYNTTLGYDPVRNRLVLFVGAISNNNTPWMYEFDTDTLTYLPSLPRAAIAIYHKDSDSFVATNTVNGVSLVNTVYASQTFRLIDARTFAIQKVLFVAPSATRSITFSQYNPGHAYFTTSSNRVYKQPLPFKTYRYQFQATPGVYEEILVDGLKMTYFVYGDYTTTGDEFNDELILIPLDRSITRQYSIPKRELLYARSLHFVFNSVVITEIKWYQTGIFKALLLIVAIVITIYTYGADGGSTIATALSLSGTAGLIATIVVNLAIGQLIAAGFTLFVQKFGTKAATAVAVLAIAYGAYDVVTSGSVLGAPWAQTLLQLSTGLQQAVLRQKYSDLLADADQFNLFAKDRTEELETAQALLETNHLLDPIVIFGEKPEDFYNRTVHFGNIGTLGITAISSYVDIALTLPKLNDTLGEEFNAA